MALKLTMTCGSYDRARALIDGTVKPEGIDLAVHVNSDDPSRQREARERKFDVVEFYTGLYIGDLPYKTLGFTAVPIFVKRMFRHSYIYINRRSGIQLPKDLNGKRIGIQTWLTTTALWGRGILEDEFGVDLKSITWVADRQETIGGWRPPSWLRLQIKPGGMQQFDLLSTGHIDASITTGTWAPDAHPDIDFLFPNYAQLEREYFKRTGFFPIMHTLLIKTEILEQHPWVAMSMFDAWQRSKQHCYEWLERQRVHRTSLWYRALWEEERAVAGPDIYPWGFKKTRAEVDQMLAYAYRQGMVPQKFTAEDMFHPTTFGT
jgi:4,5-dihydroxyphthalate decarboxylase